MANGRSEEVEKGNISNARASRPAAFDLIAQDYDQEFSSRTLGRWLRDTTWSYLNRYFSPRDHVLDLGCGTGLDAIMLAEKGLRITATDVSTEMLSQAEQRTNRVGLSDSIRYYSLDLNDLAENFEGITTPFLRDAPFDGAYSNFGALNSLKDLTSLRSSIAKLVRPGGYLVLVLMGPICLWEMSWFLVHGKTRDSIRRLRRNVIANAGRGQPIRVWYPSPYRVKSIFSSHFTHKQTAAVGLLLPPSYLADHVDRHPRVYSTLRRIDSRVRDLPLTPTLSDHYLIVFKRKRGTID